VAMPADHSGAGQDEPRPVAADYERAVTQASDLLVAHLKSRPEDALLSRSRHGDETPTLYRAVVATFPELERMRLTSLMWDQVVQQSLSRLERP
jgi:hypothetical protein